MDNLRIFCLCPGRPAPRRPFRTEAQLQAFIVRHARLILQVKVLAEEYPITANGRGRIDALGIDERGRPVIMEFKRSATGTAIGQGLFYLDWLDQHRDQFAALVRAKLGSIAAARITWPQQRLLCIAEEIGAREEAVARQIGRAVELIQLRRLPHGLVILQSTGSQTTTDHP